MLNGPVPRSQWAAVVILAAVLLGILVSRYAVRRHASEPPSPLPVVVRVEGDVREPGVYLLAGRGGAVSVGEALQAAGGAGRSSFEPIPEQLLMQEVPSGRALEVLRHESNGWTIEQRPLAGAARLTLGQKLDLNTASAEELGLLPQMKPPWAEAIVKRRERSPWKQIEELREIPGVGAKTVDKWRNHLEVGQ